MYNTFMKRKIYILSFCIAFCANLFAQNVSDVSFYQEGKNIIVTYSLDKTANVSVQVSTDGGVTYSAPLKHVSGDVGKDVTAGTKQIVWDVLSEYDSFSGENIMFLVTVEGSKRSFTVNGVTFNMIHVQVDASTQNESSNKLSNFYIGETEVTQALWEAVMETTIYQQRDKAEEYYRAMKAVIAVPLSGIGPNYPMYYINWNECCEFVQRLSLLTGESFRLPTEAEWEFAARGGNGSMGYKYSGSDNAEEVAWYSVNSGGSTHAVATKKANELGIYDMTGNLREWCSDIYPSYRCRALRGGCWSAEKSFARISYRTGSVATDSYYNRGLRLVLVP